MDILNIIIGIFQAFINWLTQIFNFGKPTTTTPEPTTTTPEPTTTTPEPGIAKMDLSQGIASMNLFQTFGTTTPPPTQKPIIDAIKTSLTLKNDGNGINYKLNGLYDGKDVVLIDKNHINDYLLGIDDPKYVYKKNEIVEFTFTNTDINQDYKIKLRILNSSLEFVTIFVSSVKFMATTSIEIPVAPSVYTSLKLNDGIIELNNDGIVKQYTLLGTYDGKSVTLVDEKNKTFFNNPEYVYKVNEIAEFTFTNPISNQDSKVNLKITKVNMDVGSNFNLYYTFNSILSPPVAENYQSFGVF